MPRTLSVFSVASRHLEYAESILTLRLVTKACPLGSHLKNLNTGMFQSYISIPRDKPGAGNLAEHVALSRGEGLWWEILL